jgi:transposase
MVMGRHYSEDFRLRVLERVDAGMNKLQAHRTFGVSRSTLDDWLRLREAQGHVRNKPRARRRDAALPDRQVFGEFAARHQGATLAQMAQAWQEEKGEQWSRNTFSLALRALGWTRKKRVSSTEFPLPRATPGRTPGLCRASSRHSRSTAGVCG